MSNTQRFIITGGALEGYVEGGPPVEPPTEPPPTEPPPTEPPPEPPIDPPDPPTEERRYPVVESARLFDTSGHVLRDEDWLRDQPRGTIANICEVKKDSSKSAIQLSAPGTGYQGGRCLELIYLAKGTNNQGPGFWICRYEATGGSKARVSGSQKYLAPGFSVANRLSFRVKFPPGFGITNGADLSKHRNYDIGTYHARADGSSPEDNGCHFYHQLKIRFDEANNDWLYVEINAWPTHRRGTGTTLPPNNPTDDRIGLDYFPSLTRFYVDIPYVRPEIDAPFSVLYDDIRMLHVDETSGPDTEEDWVQGPVGPQGQGWQNFTSPLVETQHFPAKGPWDRAV